MEYNFLRCINGEGKVLAMMTSLMSCLWKRVYHRDENL